ncbi:DUF2846 domain-containing protein [Microbulbifer sp. SA54]|uniref:DUF2846 domain-containing protein n=1 Tax=Microbulbifer sp. SA54 TaxID=3401577 RepID=UPI003AAAC288
MRTIILFVCLILVSCASPTVIKGAMYSGQEEVPREKAIVYLFRPAAFVGSAREYNMFIDGEVAAVLANGTYTTVELSPGEHSFGVQIVKNWMGGGPYLETTYNIEPGKEYFLGYFKSLPLGGSKQSDYFLHKKQSEVFSGLHEGGLLDADHLIGFVHKQHALMELQKLRLAVGFQLTKKI